MSRVGRAVEKGEPQGLMKVVVDAKTRRSFGAVALTPEGRGSVPV
jgi:pyruvate/2-oxoglutarate dehydrogenase complex dihydrolipoamide dehydrogenase (E3) component